ncbi:hypothetical protein LS684_06800 [Cytobacillus spongiae]|jgi:magnesium-transporting ATPase (P-type)|uniref:hypothetical protein n=1 Tax=Cytobacillus spongiae TaxID=2901381 RepID=UPI001F26AE1F|nr:hypothetical protein [Cytobacillus spongiae]UII57144.1 hypothetical protein LS684_06800 [Cytobacillus spongiae]
MQKLGKLEVMLWNIALPGFSQLLMRQYVKGILFIFLEITINMFARFNLAILYSFQGEIEQALNTINFQWILFYPCLYMYALWDGYRSVMSEDEKYSYLPFVFSAYSVTVGVFYSAKLKLYGVLIGPVFLPMLFLIPGIVIGLLLKYLMIYIQSRQ